MARRLGRLARHVPKLKNLFNLHYNDNLHEDLFAQISLSAWQYEDEVEEKCIFII